MKKHHVFGFGRQNVGKKDDAPRIGSVKTIEKRRPIHVTRYGA